MSCPRAGWSRTGNIKDAGVLLRGLGVWNEMTDFAH